jgi:hypothetical protein
LTTPIRTLLERVGRKAEDAIQAGIRQGAQKFVDTFKAPPPTDKTRERLGFILSAIGAGYLMNKLIGRSGPPVQPAQTINNADPYAFYYSGQPQLNSPYQR